MNELIGKTHNKLIDWLENDWLNNGPCVCFIEGISGAGKRFVADHFLQKIKHICKARGIALENDTNLNSLLLELNADLEPNNELSLSIQRGDEIPIMLQALEKVLMKQVVIVIYEFQYLLTHDTNRPIKLLQALFDRLARRPELPGRILLLTHRSVDSEYCSRHHEIHTLPMLPPDESVELLTKLLKETKREMDSASACTATFTKLKTNIIITATSTTCAS